MSIYRLLFFFFKQKTAYEMRISDWSSDVCSSDLEKKIKPASWGSMDNEAVIADLCAIRGIGRWTAEMFLIFNLQRPDVLPLDDLGLLKAISLHYFSGEPVSRFEAREVSSAWQPWRTVATWYLWRSLESKPILNRTEERRVGKESVSTCKYRGSQYN